MFKLSVPISSATVNKETLPKYVDYIKRGNIDRVFLCGMGELYDEEQKRNY